MISLCVRHCQPVPSHICSLEWWDPADERLTPDRSDPNEDAEYSQLPRCFRRRLEEQRHAPAWIRRFGDERPAGKFGRRTCHLQLKGFVLQSVSMHLVTAHEEIRTSNTVRTAKGVCYDWIEKEFPLAKSADRLWLQRITINASLLVKQDDVALAVTSTVADGLWDVTMSQRKQYAVGQQETKKGCK